MKQAPIIERLNRIEEQQQELKLLLLSVIRLLKNTEIINEDALRETMIDISDILEEEKKTDVSDEDTQLSELSYQEEAFRRECRLRGTPPPSSSAFEAEFIREYKRREAAPAHHYNFVHHILRDACQEGQEFFFNSMANPVESSELLKQMWQKTCQESDNTGRPLFWLEDRETHATLINGFPAIVTIMPPPEHVCEAFMAAAVLLVPADEWKTETLLTTPEVAFVTLERSHYEIPVIGAWKGTQHYFIGLTSNMTPTKIAKEPGLFIEIVEELISTDRESVAWKTVVGTA